MRQNGVGVMTSDMVKNFYRDILKKVLVLEAQKKENAQRILILRSNKARLPWIRDFLNADLLKHRLLEQATVSATQNEVEEVLDHIKKLYSMSNDLSLIESIRLEIAMDEKMLDLIIKKIKHPKTCTFSERRILQDVNKYVIHQAREYAKVNS